MSRSSTSVNLSGVLEQLQSIAADAQKSFGGLTAAQLNWKPSAQAWSAGQCFEHLIKTNEMFFSTLEQIRKGERKSSAWERLSPFSGLFGKLVARSLKPESSRKFKAPATLQPSSSDVEAGIVNKFVEHQQELVRLMAATKDLNLEKIIITSPFAKFMTYSVLNAYSLLVVHEQRHFAQAQRVLESENFPRA